jgi:hypothetical protein
LQLTSWKKNVIALTFIPRIPAFAKAMSNQGSPSTKPKNFYNKLGKQLHPSLPPQWRHVIFRRTMSEGIEFLTDAFCGRVAFSRDPADAKTTGYSWLYIEEARKKLIETRNEEGVKDLEIMLVLFERQNNGQWIVTQSQFLNDMWG